MFGAGGFRSAVIAASGSPLAPPGETSCSNCGAGPVRRYCAECGQRHITPHDFTAIAFLRDTLSEFISIDGRLWLTLWTLVRYPGKLAREYFDGRGSRYMRPLNLFLLLNLVFFVVQPHTGLLQWHLKGYLNRDGAPALVEQTRMARARSGDQDLVAHDGQPVAPRIESMDVFESEFEATIQNLKKSMLLVAIPLFAMMLAAAYGFRRRFAEHLIFATHFYAFSVFTLAVLIPLAFTSLVGWLRLMRASRSAYAALSGEGALTAVLFVLLGGYLYPALQRMYGDSRPVALVRAAGLFVAYQAIVILFSVSMFRVTLWAM